MGWGTDPIVEQAPATAGWGKDPIVQPAARAARALPVAPTRLEALLRGGGQGVTFGFGDEVNGAIQALGEKLGGSGKSLGDLYRLNRDSFRREDKAAEDAHGGYYLGGNLAGGLLTAPLLPGGSAKSLAQALKTGATMGAAAGLGSGSADLTRGDVGQALMETGTGAVFGAGGGLLGYGLAKGLPALSQALRARGINGARRVLLNGADSLSTRTILPDAAAEEALKSGAIVPFGTTKGAAARLETMAGDQAAKYSGIVQQLEAAGVKGPAAKDIADELLKRAVAAEPNTMNRAVPETYLAAGQDVMSKADQTGTIPLGRSENLKRSLQQAARKAYRAEQDTEMGDAKKAIASVFRQANEDVIDRATAAAGPGSQIAELGSDFVPTKQRLGRLIEASDAAERGAKRAGNRAHFSLNDTILAGAGLSHGGPAGLGLGILNNLARNRGASTMARAYYGAGNLLGSNALGSGTVPAALALAANPGPQESAPAMWMQHALADAIRRRLEPDTGIASSGY